MKQKLLSIALLLLSSLGMSAQTFSGHQVASEGAWCWFADPRATHYENADKSINMSYIGYIDVHGAVKASQYNWNTGEKQDVLVRSYFQPDDHNNPTFLVLPDERVLIIYSRHTDEAAFYYRVSLKPGDITQLGEEKRLATANNTTYPSPFIMSDDPTHWYLCWRGISWHPTIARLTMPDENGDCKFDWGPYQMVQSTGARPYAKYYSNGKDKLYVTYTTGHPDNESPNWVYFNVININKGGEPTLEDIKGTKLSTIKNGPFKVNKETSYKSSYPYTVVDAPSNGIRDWVWQIALDKKDNPRIAMVKINSAKTQHEYYYARWTGSAWALTDICDGGAKFHPSNTEYCYSGGEALDQQNPNIMYVSKPTPGTYGNIHEIWKYTLDDNGKKVGEEQITKNSKKNNVRPFVLPGSEGSPLRLAWMNGDYQYWIVCKNYPKGYPTSIMCDYDMPLAPASTKGWSISRTLQMDASKYSGELLRMGNIVYSLSATTHKPEIKIGGAVYSSQNQLYTSDAWQTCPATTDGKSYSSILSSWNLTLTYDSQKKQLTSYRNGLIDQIIDVELTTVPEGVEEGCMNQAAVQQHLEADILKQVCLPAKAVTDVVLPTSLNGEGITWTSSNEDVLSAAGIFNAPAAETEVKLTASTSHASRTYCVMAMPRNIQQNLLCSYDFSDTKDKSGRGNDLTLKGSAKVNGVLDLTANTASGFSSNGYAILPATVMDSLRSYTILFEATPKSLSNAPRFYDFGFNSGNSIFCRANAFCAGIKYAGGSTTMTSASKELQAGKTYKIAVVYNAGNHNTTIYLDGEVVASGVENQNEPYMISLDAKCDRNYLGRTQWWDSNVASSNVDYVGTMDNFQMYNTTLTRKEVCKAQGLPFDVEPYTTEFVNGDLEDSYSVFVNPKSDRAIYQPEGWTIEYGTRDENDLTAMKDGDLYYSNFFAAKPQPNEAGQHTLWIRQRWGASLLNYYQNVLLPAGEYTLTADVFATQNGQNNAAVYVGESRKTVSTLNAWQTLSFTFTSNGEDAVKIGFQATHTADEFICGFDNFRLQSTTPTAVVAPLQSAERSALYDLSGRPASSSRKGVVVRNGKLLLSAPRR